MAKHFYTTHLSGTFCIPHNWTREMPNDARYGTDKPTAEDITNYSQIAVYTTKDGGQYCTVSPIKGSPWASLYLAEG